MLSGLLHTVLFDNHCPLVFSSRKWRLQPLRPTPLQASLTAELTGSAYTSRVILSGRSHRGARGGDDVGGAGAADLWPCLALAHATGVGIITRAAAAIKIPAQKHRRTIIHRCEMGHFYAADYFHMALSSFSSHSQDWRPHSAFGVIIRPSLRAFRESPTESRFEVQIWGDLSFRTFSGLNRINW